MYASAGSVLYSNTVLALTTIICNGGKRSNYDIIGGKFSTYRMDSCRYTVFVTAEVTMEILTFVGEIRERERERERWCVCMRLCVCMCMCVCVLLGI